LFNTLATLVDLSGARFADLFAGTGAVGLEALSRGAAHVLLVERDAAAVRALHANVAALGLDGAEIVHARVECVVDTTPSDPYDVVFLDPPYGFDGVWIEKLLADIVNGGWLRIDGVCVVERDRRSAPPAWPGGLAGTRSRHYGETMLWYGSRS
jgi:16S rRNA (guanine966-N2)-methyltransferase